MIRQEQKSTEAKYYKLREECLGRQQQLLDLNSDMREDLSKLQASVQEQLIPATSGGEGMPEDLVAPDKTGGVEASVDFTEANNAEHSSSMDEKDKIADYNQGGNEDGVEPGIHERAPGQEDQLCSTDQNDTEEKRHPALVVSKEQQPSGGDTTCKFPAGALSETTKDDRATPLRRAEARKRWEKVRGVVHSSYLHGGREGYWYCRQETYSTGLLYCSIKKESHEKTSPTYDDTRTYSSGEIRNS